MFTGLVEDTGTIVSHRREGAGVRLEIAAPGLSSELSRGQSVAVNGVCLTVTECDERRFGVTAVPETLRSSALGDLVPGDRVNLERAVRVGDRLDGHIVQGHVDGVGEVVCVEAASPGLEATLRVPRELARYVAAKGSIAVDGVSLTIASVDDDRFRVALVPHTLEVTTLNSLEPGRRVNVEVDLTARYVERLLAAATSPERTKR